MWHVLIPIPGFATFWKVEGLQRCKKYCSYGTWIPIRKRNISKLSTVSNADLQSWKRAESSENNVKIARMLGNSLKLMSLTSYLLSVPSSDLSITEKHTYEYLDRLPLLIITSIGLQLKAYQSLLMCSRLEWFDSLATRQSWEYEVQRKHHPVNPHGLLPKFLFYLIQTSRGRSLCFLWSTHLLSSRISEELTGFLKWSSIC